MEEEKKKIIFQKLTPVDDIDMNVYEDALEYVFSNDDVRNIAVSGAYGAGKSSLLETYKRDHSEKKFLSISLAHFKKCNGESGDIGVKIEGRIINQLIHQMKEECVPLTNFRMKRELDKKRINELTKKIVLFFSLVIYVLNYNAATGWVECLGEGFLKSILQIVNHPYVLLLALGVIIYIFAVFVQYVVSHQKGKFVLRKLNFQGTEIEIFEKEKESYFDKYLNEVLYLLEKTEVDAIVFEDIDRFDNITVFERLREINALVNIRFTKAEFEQNKKVLRFFYLMRDDIFLGKERTKFFDYILPVIPVVDNSNSYNKLRDYFGQCGILGKFDDKFLKDLALYIDDMRILKNICNEFMIYFNRLEVIDLNYNKMLAIITYKNIYPKDYSDLQLNKGFVKGMFNQKESIINDKIQFHKEEISKLEKRIEEMTKEHLETVEELEDVKVARKNRFNNTYDRREKYEKWEQEIYAKRKQIIEDIRAGKQIEYEERIAQLQNEIENMRGRTLSELLSEGTYEDVFNKYFSSTEMKKIKTYSAIVEDNYFMLLVFLMRNGYLDETYSDYMTYFYPNSLTVGDKKFLRSISDKVSIPYSYKLDKPVLVMENLNAFDFDKEEVLNFDLFSTLLQGKGKEEYLDRFIRQLSKGGSWGFIAHFWRQCNEKKELLVSLNRYWPTFFLDAINGRRISDWQLNEISVDMLAYMELADLEKMNLEGCLVSYISNNGMNLFMENENDENLNEKILLLNIQFKCLPDDIKNISLFEYVYSHNLYEINVNNIKVILKFRYNVSDVESVIAELVSFIFSKKEEPLYEYVKNNINVFMEALLQEPIEGFADKSEDVISLLNDERVEASSILSYIAKLKTVVETLPEVNNSVYVKELLCTGKAKYSSEKIWDYFFAYGLTTELVQFINGNTEVLDFGWTRELENDQRLTFWNACISCKDLSDKKYSEIMSTMGYCYKNFGIKGISQNKLLILVNKGIIHMTQESLEFIRANYPDCVFAYINRNPKEYVEIAKGEVASANEVAEILEWDNFSDGTKIQMLSEIEDEIAITGMNYSEKVMHHILENNFCLDDLPDLCEEYEAYPDIVKQDILQIAEGYIDEVVENVKKINPMLLIALLSKEDIELVIRIKLLAKHMDKLTRKECVRCLRLVNANEIVRLFDKQARPRIPVNKSNELIMLSLKRNDYIKEFSIDKERGIYRYSRGRRILINL